IRDRNVTGVQTCALPILTNDVGTGTVQRYFSGNREATLSRSSNTSTSESILNATLRLFSSIHFLTRNHWMKDAISKPGGFGLLRSEERRVGKEGRSRMGG